MGLVLEACVDILVATSLCYFFLKSRRHSVLKRWVAVQDTESKLEILIASFAE
jgi:hypothetical protein